MKSLGLSTWKKKHSFFPSSPKIARASDEVLQVKRNNVRHEMKGNQRHPPPISIDPGLSQQNETLWLRRVWKETLLYYMLLDLCIILLLEKLQSVFGSEDFVTIAQKKQYVQKSAWEYHEKAVDNTCQKPTKNIVVGRSFGFFWGLLRQENVNVRTCYIWKDPSLQNGLIDLLEIRSQS